MARVTLATAEFEAAPKMIEAAKMYETSQRRLTTPMVNILYELGQPITNLHNNASPSSHARSRMAARGTYGFKELPKDQKDSEPKKTATRNQE